jgi:uncharacterized protein YciI
MDYVVISRFGAKTLPMILKTAPAAGFLGQCAKSGKKPSKEELVGAGVPAELAPVMAEHFAYLVDLEKRGSLKGAGPCSGFGVAILWFEAPSEAQARALHDGDPFARDGILQLESIYEWHPVFMKK